MKVVIQDLEGRQYEITGVETGQQVNKLKQKIHGFAGVSPADQTLMYLGQELIDDTILSEYNIVEGIVYIMQHSNEI